MIVKISESIINEALKPSEFRDLMKVGRELAMERISQIWPRLEAMADAKNRSGDRLYFDIEQSNDLEIPSKNEITNFLSNNNYDIVDFSKGFVKKKDDKNIVKLGKVLTMFGKSDETALDLLQKYNNEKSVIANTGAEYLMVISKHPYDIGGMATDRSWKSCMNLRGDNEERHYVPIDIKQGTIISYLIQKDDKNIQNPKSRILIKPYINEENSDNILYGIERNSIKYGSSNQKYVKTLISVLDEAQQEKTGVFKIDEDLYSDGETKIIKIDAKKIKEVEDKIGGQIKELRDGLTFKIITENFSWLYKENVIFKNAVLGLDKEDLKWYDGVWQKGIWKNGTWENGTWENGTWMKGYWYDGIWENGNWEAGYWKKGIWNNGIWERGIWVDGNWMNGTWEGGIWEGGIWVDGNWMNGTWEYGSWENGIWKNGIWKKGNWEDGTWEDGTWEDGYWYKGDWKGGVWETGQIWDEDEKDLIESNTPPK